MGKLNLNKVAAVAQKAGIVPTPSGGGTESMLSSEIIDLGQDQYAQVVSAAMDACIDFGDPLLDEEKEVNVLGQDQYGYEHKYVRWGTDDLMPLNIAERIGSDETVNSSMEFLKKICYGSGIKFCACEAEDGDKKTLLQSVDDWFDDNNLSVLALTQAKNYKTYGWCLDVVILDMFGTNVTDVYVRDVEDVRIAPRLTEGITDGSLYRPAGIVPFAYYGKFNMYQNLRLSDVEIIPLLDERTPLKDLKVLMGKERDPRTGLYRCDDPTRPSGIYGDVKNYPTCKMRKFGILRRLPMTEKRVYPIPPHGAIFKGNWFAIKHAIEAALTAKIKNGSQIKYLVTIHPQYWNAKLNENHINGGLDSKEGQELRKRLMSEIRDYLTGSSNANKTIMTGMVTNVGTGDVTDMIKISVIDNKTQGGDWAEDITEATNMLCYGMGIHPSLVGAVPGKSGNNNSGSDKRELYTIAQANEYSTRDVMLLTYRVILKYNGWWASGIRCSIPFLQLTTLDEHISAKEVEPSNKTTE